MMKDNTEAEHAHDDLWHVRLTEYLDNAMTPTQRADFEAELAADADKQVELDDTRTIVQALRALPEVKVPRSFALTAADVAVARPRPLYRFAQVAAAIAAAFLVFLLVADFFGTFTQSKEISVAVVTTLPDIPTVNPCATGQPGVNCTGGQSAPSNTVNTVTTYEKRTVTTSDSGTVQLIEVGLVLVVVALVLAAFISRPRAPGRRI